METLTAGRRHATIFRGGQGGFSIHDRWLGLTRFDALVVAVDVAVNIRPCSSAFEEQLLTKHGLFFYKNVIYVKQQRWEMLGCHQQ